MSDERQQMRTTLAWTAGIFGWILFVTAVLVAVSLQRTSQRKISALQLQLSEEERFVEHSKKEIAPFVALAEDQFPGTTADARLDLLHTRIAALVATTTKLQGRRYLDAKAVERIKAKLGNAPVLDVEIGGIAGDAESLALAGELKTVFDAAGFKVRKLAQYPGPPNDLRGVSIYSKSLLDEVLGGAIGQIFEEISQQPNQWVAKDLIGTPKPGETEPDIKIVVGSK